MYLDWVDSDPNWRIRILDPGVKRRPLSCVLLVEHKSLPATNCSLYVASPQYQSFSSGVFGANLEFTALNKPLKKVLHFMFLLHIRYAHL